MQELFIKISKNFHGGRASRLARTQYDNVLHEICAKELHYYLLLQTKNSYMENDLIKERTKDFTTKFRKNVDCNLQGSVKYVIEFIVVIWSQGIAGNRYFSVKMLCNGQEIAVSGAVLYKKETLGLLKVKFLEQFFLNYFADSRECFITIDNVSYKSKQFMLENGRFSK